MNMTHNFKPAAPPIPEAVGNALGELFSESDYARVLTQAAITSFRELIATLKLHDERTIEIYKQDIADIESLLEMAGSRAKAVEAAATIVDHHLSGLPLKA